MRLYQKINDEFIPVNYEVQYLLGEALQPYNRRIILTESGDFTPQVTTWARVTCIGGGGAGGSQAIVNGQAGCGGLDGGNTSFGHITARGGGGGGGGRSVGGSGGGAAGEIVSDFIKLKAGVPIAAIVGAGGIRSTVPYDPWVVNSGIPEGYNRGKGSISYQGNYAAGVGGGGAGNGETGYLHFGSYLNGNGGAGGTNGTCYGGGGGGAGAGTRQSYFTQGRGANGSLNGVSGDGSKELVGNMGGRGGSGAIFIDFCDPKRLVE